MRPAALSAGKQEVCAVLQTAYRYAVKLDVLPWGWSLQEQQDLTEESANQTSLGGADTGEHLAMCHVKAGLVTFWVFGYANVLLGTIAVSSCCPTHHLHGTRKRLHQSGMCITASSISEALQHGNMGLAGHDIG